MNPLPILIDKKLLNPPAWVRDCFTYVTVVGSEAYGFATDTSDKDIYSCVMQPREQLFGHEYGHLENFGPRRDNFETYTKHGVLHDTINYDITIHGIIKYFNLLLDNNPTQLETLWTPINCVLYINDVGKLIRDNRKLFLSTKCYHRYIGYAFAQLAKIDKKDKTGKRLELIEKYGFDTKSASHVKRLLGLGEQILQEGDMDLQRDSEVLKAVRRGEVTEEEIREWFSIKEKHLLKLYQESKLPYAPPFNEVKSLLLRCLETWYGSLDNTIKVLGKEENILREIRQVLDRNGY